MEMGLVLYLHLTLRVSKQVAIVSARSKSAVAKSEFVCETLKFLIWLTRSSTQRNPCLPPEAGDQSVQFCVQSASALCQSDAMHATILQRFRLAGTTWC